MLPFSVNDIYFPILIKTTIAFINASHGFSFKNNFFKKIGIHSMQGEGHYKAWSDKRKKKKKIKSIRKSCLGQTLR